MPSLLYLLLFLYNFKDTILSKCWSYSKGGWMIVSTGDTRHPKLCSMNIQWKPNFINSIQWKYNENQISHMVISTLRNNTKRGNALNTIMQRHQKPERTHVLLLVKLLIYSVPTRRRSLPGYKIPGSRHFAASFGTINPHEQFC